MSELTGGRVLPPPHLLQRIANNPSAEDFSQSFEFLRHIVRSYLGQADYDFASFDSILDFGCGVGRFMFAFEQELAPNQKVWGCEVHEECARWCQENIDFAETAHNAIDPPLPYDDRQFDLVYASSVFTHLRLDMQFQWAREIHRVLRPGGILFATFHGPQFFPFFYSQHQHVEHAEMNSFGDDGLFSYIRFPSPESQDQGQVQVASAHNLDFFREQFAAFEIVKRFPQSLLAGGQDLYILRRPLHGRSVELPTGASETCFWQDRGGDEGTIELCFQLDGHQRFRVYPSARTAGYYWPEFHVEIRAGDHILAQERSRPTSNRIIGETHFRMIEVAVPEHHGDVSVRLSTVVTERGTLPPGTAPDITWFFPHFS